MTLRIVRLGDKRSKNEGLRIGTVRRPPRGVPKTDWAKRDFFDVWFPDLAPSEALLKSAPQAVADDRAWKTFTRRFEKELARPEARRLLELFAALSHTTDFALGCYCADEARCHRSILRAQLEARRAKLC
jgi:uncharacterized protein YeaO (DUF488 family)